MHSIIINWWINWELGFFVLYQQALGSLRSAPNLARKTFEVHISPRDSLKVFSFQLFFNNWRTLFKFFDSVSFQLELILNRPPAHLRVCAYWTILCFGLLSVLANFSQEDPSDADVRRGSWFSDSPQTKRLYWTRSSSDPTEDDEDEPFLKLMKRFDKGHWRVADADYDEIIWCV